MLEAELTRQRVIYAQLVGKLAEIGVIDSEPKIRNKMSRGKRKESNVASDDQQLTEITPHCPRADESCFLCPKWSTSPRSRNGTRPQ